VKTLQGLTLNICGLTPAKWLSIQGLSAFYSLDHIILTEHQLSAEFRPGEIIKLGSIPPKLDRQHEEERVLLTSPTCTHFMYSIQSHSRLTQLPVLPSTSPSPLSCPRLHRMIFTVKYVRVCLTNIRCFFVTYVTQHGIWTAFSHPSPPPHMEPENVPYPSRATSYSRQQHDTFAFLPLFRFRL